MNSGIICLLFACKFRILTSLKPPARVRFKFPGNYSFPPYSCLTFPVSGSVSSYSECLIYPIRYIDF